MPSLKNPLHLGLLLCSLFLLIVLAGLTLGSLTADAEGNYTGYMPAVSRSDPTPTLTPTPIPTPTPYPRGSNLSLNSSFEEGWCDTSPCPIVEIQIPNEWAFTWELGPTGFGNEPWDIWVQPEAVHKSDQQLPADEVPLFIWDGEWTYKVFKGYGAISYKMVQDVTLSPGKYVLEINVFPDLVVGYDNGEKIWAPDPQSGEVKLIAGENDTGWLLPTFGEKNTFFYVFELDETETLSIGTAIRGRYAILNNGWFVDDWWLSELVTEELAPGVYDANGQRPLFSDEYVPAP